MAEIGHLAPAYRVPPSFPGKGAGEGKRTPRHKPDSERRQSDQHRQRKDKDNDGSSIDEYA
ncbi:MAG TPA: hypothetical protein ENI74_08450 [Gammaproteobacteria bacterium]|nr:hypothetical protein [Gammaproteobacteria bacterium]